ncbi:MAG: hypothetical protein J6P39_02735, partial [Oscillospiraceae bacterium]|nr:hypothetical protein [Oscillospiraceae bacterium]
MYELITESINRIEELLADYKEAEKAAAKEQEEYLKRLRSLQEDPVEEGAEDEAAKDPVLEKLLSDKMSAIRQSVHVKTVLAISGRADMPKRKVVRQIAETEEYRALFQTKLDASSEYKALLQIKAPSQLSAADFERYKEMLAGEFTSETVYRRNHLRNLIKKECRNLIDLIDIRDEIADQRPVILDKM